MIAEAGGAVNRRAGRRPAARSNRREVCGIVPRTRRRWWSGTGLRIDLWDKETVMFAHFPWRPGHAAAALITSILVLASASAAEPRLEKTDRFEAGRDGTTSYRVVPGWPALPDGFRFGQVSAVATDSDDRVFVFHRGDHPVVVFDRDGKFLRWWGDGLVKKAHGLRIDGEGNVWVTDIGDHLVRKFDREGKLLMTLGRQGMPGASRDQFNQPTDVAIAPDRSFYVSDGYGNARVVKFAGDGRFVLEWGTKGKAAGQFDLPHAIVVDSRGQIYVGDRENDRIQVFGPDGTHRTQWTEGGAPFGLFLTGSGRLFVADGRANRVLVLDREGKLVERWGEEGSAPGAFSLPHALCVDSRGDLYVTEITGQRIQKFSAQ
jgi:DNA-binding beta-propeller fold protein YncE